MNTVSVKEVGNISECSTRIGVAVARAMDGAPDYQFVLQKKNGRVQPLSWFFGSFAAKLALQFGRLLATDDNDAGIFAFAPNQSPSLLAVLKAGALLLPFHFGFVGAWRAFLLGLHLEKRRSALMTEPHWYILAIGVEPTSQSQGKGRALLDHLLKRADTDHVPTYLEVFEEHLIPLYQSLGFNALEQEELPGGLTLWCLKRPAINAR